MFLKETRKIAKDLENNNFDIDNFLNKTPFRKQKDIILDFIRHGEMDKIEKIINSVFERGDDFKTIVENLGKITRTVHAEKGMEETINKIFSNENFREMIEKEKDLTPLVKDGRLDIGYYIGFFNIENSKDKEFFEKFYKKCEQYPYFLKRMTYFGAEKVDKKIFDEYIKENPLLLTAYISSNKADPQKARKGVFLFVNNKLYKDDEVFREATYGYIFQFLQNKDIIPIIEALKLEAKKDENARGKIKELLNINLSSIMNDPKKDDFVEKNFDYLTEVFQEISDGKMENFLFHCKQSLDNKEIFKKYLDIAENEIANGKMDKNDFAFALNFHNIEKIDDENLIKRYIKIKNVGENSPENFIKTYIILIAQGGIKINKSISKDFLNRFWSKYPEDFKNFIKNNLLKGRIEESKVASLIFDMSNEDLKKWYIETIKRNIDAHSNPREKDVFVINSQERKNLIEKIRNILERNGNKENAIELFEQVYSVAENEDKAKLAIMFLQMINNGKILVNDKVLKLVESIKSEIVIKSLQKKTDFPNIEIVEEFIKLPIVDFSKIAEIIKIASKIALDRDDIKEHIAFGLYNRRKNNIDDFDLLDDKDIKEFFYDKNFIEKYGKYVDDEKLYDFLCKKSMEEEGELPNSLKNNIYFESKESEKNEIEIKDEKFIETKEEKKIKHKQKI